MIKKLIIILLYCNIFYITSAYQINPIAEKWFSKFSIKIEKQYDINWSITFYNKLNTKIDELLVTKSFNIKQINLIKSIKILSTQKIVSLKYQEKSKQKLLETIKDKYKNQEYIPNIKEDFQNKELLEQKIINEQKFEKQLIEINKQNKLFFDNHSVFDWFKYYLFNNNYIFQENWIWYTIKFSNHFIFNNDNDDINKNDIYFNWIKPQESAIFIKEENNQVWFIKEFEKIKLIDNELIYWIPNKMDFLRELKDDKQDTHIDTDIYFEELKKKTVKLTEWKTQNQKIQIIYDYILKNTKYLEDYNNNYYIANSWIKTYINKNWICWWYTKLFMYMLSFALIEDVKVMRWHVIDSKDFPQIWHAWVSIWDKYYDPTFDDPIIKNSDNTDNTNNTNIYFDIPKDIFYINRVDYTDLKENLKTSNSQTREQIILYNVSIILEKYKDSNYKILKQYLFKYNNNINLLKQINLTDLEKILTLHKVTNFSYKHDWITKHITKLKFYIVNNENINDFLIQLNYNLDWFLFLKWTLPNWQIEYRLAYNIEFLN